MIGCSSFPITLGKSGAKMGTSKTWEHGYPAELENCSEKPRSLNFLKTFTSTNFRVFLPFLNPLCNLIHIIFNFMFQIVSFEFQCHIVHSK